MSNIRIREQVKEVPKSLLDNFEVVLDRVKHLDDQKFDTDKYKTIVFTGTAANLFVAESMIDSLRHTLKKEVKLVVSSSINVSRYTAKYDDATLLVLVTNNKDIKRDEEALNAVSIDTLILSTDERIEQLESTYKVVVPVEEDKTDITSVNQYLVLAFMTRILIKRVDGDLLFFKKDFLRVSEELITRLESNIDLTNIKLQKVENILKSHNRIEIVADKPHQGHAKYIASLVTRLSGKMCPVIDSENYCHVNTYTFPRESILTLHLVDKKERNISRILETINQTINEGRETFVISVESLEVNSLAPGNVFETVLLEEMTELNSLFMIIPGIQFATYCSNDSKLIESRKEELHKLLTDRI